MSAQSVSCGEKRRREMVRSEGRREMREWDFKKIEMAGEGEEKREVELWREDGKRRGEERGKREEMAEVREKETVPEVWWKMSGGSKRKMVRWSGAKNGWRETAKKRKEGIRVACIY